MAIPYDNWQNIPANATPETSSMLAPPVQAPAGLSSGASSAAPSSVSQWIEVAKIAPILLDRRSSLLQKMNALDAMEKRTSLQKRESLARQFGSELAATLDKGLDPKGVQKAIMGMVQKYNKKGLRNEDAMRVAAGYMNFYHTTKAAEREDADFKEKTEARERKRKADEAFRALTAQVPDPALYQPGSFRALGIGSPSGAPAQAPSTAAPGNFDASLQEWLSKVRGNPDIPFDKKESFIKQATGYDPAAERAAMYKMATSGSGKSGKEGEVKYSNLINKLKYEAMLRRKNGTADEADMALINDELDPFIAKAAQVIMSNPASWSLDYKAKTKQIVETAKIMREQSMEGRGVMTIRDRNNLRKYMQILRGATK